MDKGFLGLQRCFQHQYKLPKGSEEPSSSLQRLLVPPECRPHSDRASPEATHMAP